MAPCSAVTWPIAKTDPHVRNATCVWPLSVSANFIGLTAMRCAGLLDALAPVDRAGAGRVVEVYPAAALRVWERAGGVVRGGALWRSGYKQAADRGRGVLEAMLIELQSQLPALTFVPGAEKLCRDSHDAFDALVCALVARASANKQTGLPQSGEQARLAGVEGWIHLPSVALSGLAEDPLPAVARDGQMGAHATADSARTEPIGRYPDTQETLPHSARRRL